MAEDSNKKKPPRGLVAALRDNLSILQELASRYDVATVNRPGPGPIITSPGAAWCRVKEMGDLAQEQLRVLSLDSRNLLLGIHVIYVGNINTCLIRSADVFRPAIIANAANIVVAHNHPSGDPQPSLNDVAVTKQLLRAGRLLGLYVLDHIIVGSNLFISLKEETSANPNWLLNWSQNGED